MNIDQRINIVETSRELHHQVEAMYLKNQVHKGDAMWLETQRILLADMALHLLQTSINPGEMELDKLRNNLHAILTISDQFLPHAGLKKATENLY